MCGRITLRRPLQDVVNAFSANLRTNFELEFDRLNVRPTEVIPIVRLAKECHRRELIPARWGLVPSWTNGAFPSLTFNARCDTAFTKPTFRSAIQSRRCLIPIDGFYEPDRRAKKAPPFFIHKTNDDLFALAGLWERWHDHAGHPLDSCTILTTDPNPLLATFHQRMPVILSPDDYDAWLTPATPEPQLKSLLKPYAPTDLEAYPVQRMGALQPPAPPEKDLFT